MLELLVDDKTIEISSAIEMKKAFDYGLPVTTVLEDFDNKTCRVWQDGRVEEIELSPHSLKVEVVKVLAHDYSKINELIEEALNGET